MASLNNKIIKLKAKEFNIKRKKKLPTGIQYFFLKKVGRTTAFTVELEIFDCYHIYNKYREMTVLQVATLSPAFEDALEVSSDLAIGGYVYEIEKRDVSPPDGNRPWWEIYCRKSTARFSPV